MRILLTRPLPDAERTIAALRERGHEVLHAPLLRIDARSDAAIGPGPWDGVLLTSANAARVIEAHPRFRDLLSIPLIAVGARTAAAARETGFLNVVSAEGDQADLVAQVADMFRGRVVHLLYLAGEDRTGDLGGALTARGFPVETAVVYRATAAEALPREALKALSVGTIDAVLHYSPRSADLFVRMLDAEGPVTNAAHAAHFCLSEQVAAPLRAAGFLKIEVASRPTEDSLLELLPKA